MHLTDLLLPDMLQNAEPAAIVNVTSGGAFVPQPFAPGYSAAKAALHSFTMKLRHALAGTTVRVIEVIPPAVATGLSGLENPHGANTDEFCDAAFAAITAGTEEIGFGPTATSEFTTMLNTDRTRFEQAAARFQTPTYRRIARTP